MERSWLGVIRAAELEAMGMSSSTVYRRCLPDGPWQRLLPGVVVLQKSSPTADQKAVAAMLYCGSRGVLTGAEACRRHGLRAARLPLDGRVHVLLPQRYKAISSEFLTVERTWRMPAPVFRADLPLAPLIRSVTDAARQLRAFEPVVTLLVEAVQRGRCAPRALSYELDRGTKRGTAIPRRVLAEINHVRSVAEFHARRVAAGLEVQPTHWNRDIFDRSGRYIACPDAWWDDVGLGWEIDSVEFHFYGADYARTLARNTRYAEAGVSVVQTLPSRLLNDTAAVLRELRTAYRAASARPRPPVRLGDAA
ncbi:hypothetical protein [Prauserella shujinwangii]|uniref:hypothetical protein n=1 Tax=Prauserella shujinwangii TaxID=1453103 RepID=UPI001FE3BD85|nr:hypothetical protein [Prauserella shujinwangii]